MSRKTEQEVAELKDWLLEYAGWPGLHGDKAVEALGRLAVIGGPDCAFVAAVFIWPLQKPEHSRILRTTKWRPVSRQYPATVRAAARRAIGRLILEATSASLPGIDEAVRRLGREAWAFSDRRDGWIWVTPPRPRNVEIGPDRIALLGLLSGHRDGFIRQEAVEELAASSAYGALRFLLWRSTDWTPQVAVVAAEAFERRLAAAPLTEVAALLPLVVRIHRLSRAESSLIDAVDSRMTRSDGIDVLRTVFTGPDRTAGRYAAQLIAASGHHDPADVAALLGSADGVVRRTALLIEARIRTSALVEAAQIRARLAADRQPSVRSAGLAASVDADPAGCIELLKASLTDTASSVRNLAVFWLSKLAPDFDVAGAYREVLANPSSYRISALAAAASAAGDVGLAAAWDDLVCLLDSSPAVARAALRSLRKLDADRSLQPILGRLADVRPAVAKEAMAALPHWLSSVATGDLFEAWSSAEDGAGRRAVADVALRLSPWPALTWLLSASQAYPQDTLDALQRWRPDITGRYASSGPPAAVQAQLAADLKSIAPTLPPKLLERLEAEIG